MKNIDGVRLCNVCSNCKKVIGICYFTESMERKIVRCEEDLCKNSNHAVEFEWVDCVRKNNVREMANI